MKTKRLLVVLFASLMAFAVTAQPSPKGKGQKTPEERAKKQTELMKQELKLTDAQAAQVDKINIKYAIEKDKLEQEMKAKKKAMYDQKNAELKAVLTPEQFPLLEQYREKRKQERKAKHQQMKNCMQDMKANQAK